MDYSVIIPVYNSQDSLEELFTRIEETLTNITNEFEVIFVDDASKDKSWEMLSQIKKNNSKKVKIIRLAKNYGQHNATFCGFRCATGNFAVTIDDDLQNIPEDILKLIDGMKNTNADVVYGVGSKKYSAYRKAGSVVYRGATKFFEGNEGEGSSFRLIKSEVFSKIISHTNYFIFIDELLSWYTCNFCFVEVSHHKSKRDRSNYNVFKIIKILSETGYNYGTWTLQVMIYGGMAMAVFSFLLGVFFMYKKIFFGANIPGFTATIVTMLFSTSLILMCFGILGRYISNIYSILHRKPTYTIIEEQL